MLKEHDRIVLARDLPKENLVAQDIGAILHVHLDGFAVAVEFLAPEGDTTAVATLHSSQVRPARDVGILLGDL